MILQRNIALKTARKPIHGLAIDDDPSTREMIANYLGDNDMRVTALEDGSQIDEALDS